MEEKTLRSRKKKKGIWWLFPLILLLAAGSVGGFILYQHRTNEWKYGIELKGEASLVLECGTIFEDPGASSYFYGTKLDTTRVEPEILREGEVDPSKPGVYTLTYRSSYTAREQSYSWSAVRTVEYRDTTAPKLILIGSLNPVVEYFTDYEESGFYASDEVDGDLTASVKTYQRGDKLYYEVSDRSGNKTVATRDIRWKDSVPPVITLIGEAEVTVEWGEEYPDEGCLAMDEVDGDISDRIRVEKGEDDYLIYTVSDAAGNTASIRRHVSYGDTKAPVITLKGAASVTLNIGESYSDPGFSAWDAKDGDLTEQVTKKGFSRYVVGTQTLKYTVMDEAGNEATATRTITVKPLYEPYPQVAPAQKTIYLTFDDGPGVNTERVLDILEQYGAKATFFCCSTQYRNKMSLIVARGHSIGIHCATHSYKVVYQDEEAYFRDLYQMKNLIYNITGVDTHLLRFPGGSSNTSSAQYNTRLMTRLTQSVEALGFKYFDWNVAAGDSGGNQTSAQIYERVTNGIRGKAYAIVLMHDNQNASVGALEDIIKWGLENGYVFKGLDLNSPCAKQPVLN